MKFVYLINMDKPPRVWEDMCIAVERVKEIVRVGDDVTVVCDGLDKAGTRTFLVLDDVRPSPWGVANAIESGGGTLRVVDY